MTVGETETGWGEGKEVCERGVFAYLCRSCGSPPRVVVGRRLAGGWATAAAAAAEGTWRTPDCALRRDGGSGGLLRRCAEHAARLRERIAALLSAEVTHGVWKMPISVSGDGMEDRGEGDHSSARADPQVARALANYASEMEEERTVWAAFADSVSDRERGDVCMYLIYVRPPTNRHPS